jgi:hypothetical protein
MRNVARLKMGYYPLPESEGAKLRTLLSYTQPASVADPCVGQGAALHLITSDAVVRRYGIELDAERARVAGSKGIETIQGNTFDAIAKPESFSLLYLNPPYDSEIGSIANRRMEAIFLEHTYRWLVLDGVLILVIPFERLHDCAGVLSSHFAALNVFRMTDPDSVQYRQIAVLGVRRDVRGVAVENNKRQLQSIGLYGSFQKLPELQPGACTPYSVPPLRGSRDELSRPSLRSARRSFATLGGLETGGAAAVATRRRCHGPAHYTAARRPRRFALHRRVAKRCLR